jgi:toxin-antitoxin system PIN domain toxin
MILPDLNILLYAYDADSPFHAGAKKWLEDALSGSEPVALSWHTIIGFLRIGTNPRVFQKPLSIAEAIEIVEEWLACPAVKIAQPTTRHWEILQDMLQTAQAAGNLISDAHLAALAIETGASLVTTDKDFGRFGNRLKTINPLIK